MDYTPASEGEYQFPPWANKIGWCIAFSSIIAVVPASALEVLNPYFDVYASTKIYMVVPVWHSQRPVAHEK